LKSLPLAFLFAAAVGCTSGATPDLAQGPGSGLDSDLLDGRDSIDFAPASGLSTGALLPGQSRRMGAFTDVARGRRAVITGGTLGGFGPTSEYASQGYWTTSVFPSELNLDLGEATPVSDISFESSLRGDSRFNPAWVGASAYVLSVSVDGAAWTDLTAVAPVDGDHFVHQVAGAEVRYVRLKIQAPATVGNPVNVSMLRVLNYSAGESTAIDARRQYFADGVGPFCIFARSCPTGWTDRGSAGIVLSTSGSCPYTTGASFAPGWSWCHPQLCCR
jgi:hypothetical protein